MSSDDLLKQFAALSPEKQAALLAKLPSPASPVTASGERSTAGGDHSIVIGGSVFVDAATPGAIDTAALLRTYLERLIEKTRNLKLDVIDRQAATDRSQLQLASVFTGLSVMRRRLHEFDENGMAFSTRAALSTDVDASYYFESAISQVTGTPRLALLGSPGSGKSSFVDMLTLCLAGSMLGRDDLHTGLLGEKWDIPVPWLPVRVVLRQFAAEAAASGDYSLWDHIVRQLGESLDQFGPLLKKHLIETGGILLLDGFDEVPEADRCRDLVKEAVQNFADDFGQVRILLTSRPYAWHQQEWRLPGFEEATLAPFEKEQWETFIDKWYDHLAEVRETVTSGSAEAGKADLMGAIDGSDHLKELAANPLLLTLMASLHALRGGTLPRKREVLYERSVELLLDVWQKPKTVHDSSGGVILQTESAAEFLKVDQDRFLKGLEQIAFQAHQRQTGTRGTADIPEGDLVAALMALPGAEQCNPRLLAEFLRDRAGILVHESPGEHGVYRFPHRTFQEYLAARHLTASDFPIHLCELIHHDPEKWREVFLLAGAKAATGADFAGWALVDRALEPVSLEKRRHLAPDLPDHSHAIRHAALLAGRFLVESRLGETPLEDLTDSHAAIRKKAVQSLVALVTSGDLDARDRCAGASALGLLGDPRPGVGLKDRLPDFDYWCEIGTGTFLYGDDAQARQVEKDYGIGKYPITVAQFQAFVDAGGYGEKRWWSAGGYGRFTGPKDYSTIFQTPNHPRVGVSWYEAMAFCAWLTERTPGRTISLPTEYQWERAARHTDGRVYPWGNEPDEPAQRGNFGSTSIGSSSAVGAFPSGQAECGAFDFAGNVLEWCANNPSETADSRVLRGGAFWLISDFVRCAWRDRGQPGLRNDFVGFRVISSPIFS